MIRATLAALLSVSLLLACNLVPAATAPTPLSTTVRHVPQPGDTWEYAFRSTITKSATGEFTEWEGTRRNFITLVNDPMFGSVFALNVPTRRTVVAGVGVGETLAVNLQDRSVPLGDGQFRWIGREFQGVVSYIVAPQDGWITPMDPTVEIGDAISTGNIVFDDGSVISHSQVVTGIEAVTVPLGTFQAYTIEFTATASAPGFSVSTEVGMLWFVPAIGAEVKLELTRNIPLANGQAGTEVLTAEMISTTVPY